MIKVYIVEEFSWDHHENKEIFSSMEKAEEFCTKHYKLDKPNKGDKKKYWSLHGYYYEIQEYEVDI